jgi:hypothetical protein
VERQVKVTYLMVHAWEFNSMWQMRGSPLQDSIDCPLPSVLSFLLQIPPISTPSHLQMDAIEIILPLPVTDFWLANEFD